MSKVRKLPTADDPVLIAVNRLGRLLALVESAPKARGSIEGARTSPIDGAAASIPETAAQEEEPHE